MIPFFVPSICEICFFVFFTFRNLIHSCKQGGLIAGRRKMQAGRSLGFVSIASITNICVCMD